MPADDAAKKSRARRVRRLEVATSAAGRTSRKRLGGPQLTQQLNQMVAELIKENRKLKRQVVKLTERGSKVASSAVERGLRAMQRRVQKALTQPTTRRRRKPASAAASGRKSAVVRKRRKAS